MQSTEPADPFTRQNGDMPIERTFTGTTFEPAVGYCRALRVGDRILVAGTLGLTADGAPAGDAYGQARAALTRIVGALEELGGLPSDVIRTRMFATDPVGDWDAFARAHREVFGEHPRSRRWSAPRHSPSKGA